MAKTKTKRKNAPKIKYNPQMLIPIYELFRQGMKFRQVAEALGTSFITLKRWKTSNPDVAYAIARGRQMVSKEGSPGATFLEYVYKRLPEHLQEVWTQLEALKEEPNGEKRAEMLLKGHGKRSMQTLYIHALVASNFNAVEASRKINIPYITVTKWKENDPDFLSLLDTVHQMKKDFCESALMGLVSAGDTPAILFTNRTLNRDRGYDPKITIEHKGHISHNMDITSIGLPPEILQIIMEHMKKKRESLEKGTVLQLEARSIDEEDDLNEEIMSMEEAL